MTESAARTYEDDLVDDMRAHEGRVTAGPLAGHPLLIMTTRGARSRAPRRAILTWSRDGEAYVVAGTAGGSRVTPAWVHNVKADPNVTVEVGNRTYEATAEVVGDADRKRLWEQHVAALPHFASYPEQARREIPMIRIRLGNARRSSRRD